MSPKSCIDTHLGSPRLAARLCEWIACIVYDCYRTLKVSISDAAACCGLALYLWSRSNSAWCLGAAYHDLSPLNSKLLALAESFWRQSSHSKCRMWPISAAFAATVSRLVRWKEVAECFLRLNCPADLDICRINCLTMSIFALQSLLRMLYLLVWLRTCFIELKRIEKILDLGNRCKTRLPIRLISRLEEVSPLQSTSDGRCWCPAVIIDMVTSLHKNRKVPWTSLQ